MAHAGRRKFGKRYHRPGTSPGTLTPRDTPAAGPVRISVIDYNAEKFAEKKIERVDDLAPYCDSPTVTWVNVEGLHDIKILEKIGQMFGFHPLALEDVLNSGQRPKVEDYGDYHFIVMKSLRMPEADLEMEQISFFLSGAGNWGFGPTPVSGGDCATAAQPTTAATTRPATLESDGVLIRRKSVPAPRGHL